MKYTKGEWYVHAQFNVRSKETGRTVANTGGYSSNVNSAETEKENEGNALLIAGLPNLIDACRQALAIIDMAIDWVPNGDSYHDAYRRLATILAIIDDGEMN